MEGRAMTIVKIEPENLPRMMVSLCVAVRSRNGIPDIPRTGADSSVFRHWRIAECGKLTVPGLRITRRESD
jgi:hypothetical protein